MFEKHRNAFNYDSKSINGVEHGTIVNVVEEVG